MFLRRATGLPPDPVFPANLEQLGYFINDKDEIRSITDPKSYFKFFLTKNDRHNALQREAMNECIRQIIRSRLLDLGLQKINLPLNTPSNEPHLPILKTTNLSTASRVVILFYESSQDLGVFAHRIIGGAGGINAGSCVDMVKYILSQTSSPTDKQAPGIILANTGQLQWSTKLKKAVTQTSWLALPAKSAVETPYKIHPLKNTISRNKTVLEHINCIFNEVIETMVSKDAKLDIIAVSQSAVKICDFFSKQEGMYEKWCASGRVAALAAVATYWQIEDFATGHPKFQEWYHDKARAYSTSPHPVNTLISGPRGTRKVTAHGTNTYSLGEPYYSELMLPKGYKAVIDWFQEVAEAGGEYKNQVAERIVEDDEEEGEEIDWNAVEKGGFELDEYEAEKSIEGGLKEEKI